MEMEVVGASVSDGEGCGGLHGGGVASSTCVGNSTGCSGGKLKRSSSAPMINQLISNVSTSAPPTNVPTCRESVHGEVLPQPRVRRFSASFGPVSPLSPGSNRASGRMRVCQLREEEGMDVVNREAAHERTVHSTLQVSHTLSQSWEDLILTEDKKHGPSQQSSQYPSSTNKKDYSDQLHLNINPNPIPQTICGASPTRVGRQCFSPSLQAPVRSTYFCPSPSPTKKPFTTRRSLSPSPLRPSPLGGLKRKCDLDEPFITPNKRLSSSGMTDRNVGLLIAQPHSIGSLESSPSPAGGGGSVGSAGTPESICSSGSPGAPVPPYSPGQSTAGFSPAPPPSPHHFKPVSPALVSHSGSFSSGNGGTTYGGVKDRGTMGECSDVSSDAMITEDSPMPSQECKTYQEMDLSESLAQQTLNI